MFPRLSLAFILSGCTVAIIMVLDIITDQDLGDEYHDVDTVIDSALKKIITGLALLVGFAWEQSFEGASHSLGTMTEDHPALLKVSFAFSVAIVVIPAWSWYVLKNVEEKREMLSGGRAPGAE